MDAFKESFIEEKAQKVIKALENNNMNPIFAKSADDAAKIVESLLKEGDTVTHGGSVTLKECGIIDILKNGKYNYLDRSAPGLTPDEVMDIYYGEK